MRRSLVSRRNRGKRVMRGGEMCIRERALFLVLRALFLPLSGHYPLFRVWGRDRLPLRYLGTNTARSTPTRAPQRGHHSTASRWGQSRCYCLFSWWRFCVVFVRARRRYSRSRCPIDSDRVISEFFSFILGLSLPWPFRVSRKNAHKR